MIEVDNEEQKIASMPTKELFGNTAALLGLPPGIHSGGAYRGYSHLQHSDGSDLFGICPLQPGLYLSRRSGSSTAGGSLRP
jgi:hypothetical protein